MTQEQHERLRDFGNVLRELCHMPDCDRATRHLAALHGNDTWRWAYENPETLTGPHAMAGGAS